MQSKKQIVKRHKARQKLYSLLAEFNRVLGFGMLAGGIIVYALLGNFKGFVIMLTSGTGGYGFERLSRALKERKIKHKRKYGQISLEEFTNGKEN